MFVGCIFFKIKVLKNYFGNTIRVSNGLDPDQDQQNVVLIWIQTVCNGYQQKIAVAASKERVKFSKVCFDDLHPSQQFFIHFGTISCLPGLNRNYSVDKVS